MALNIIVYMIHKNEALRAVKAIRSAQEADMVYVFDTGSTEEQIEKLNDNNEYFEYGELTVSPWRYDVARNAALALIPGDVDVCVALDSDEVLAPGWRQEIEAHWVKGETTIMRYMYDWSKGVTFMQAKIHARSGYQWINPCHEFLEWYGTGPECYAGTDKFLMFHHPDDTKPRANYLPLLKLGFKERPHDHRMAYYYGRELYLASNRPELKQGYKEPLRALATKVLYRTIEMKELEKNRAEVSYCWRVIGQMNDDEGAFKKSIEELPTHREPYIWYADWLYYQGRFEEAHDQVAIALGIKNRANDYTVEYRCWDGYPYHLLSWCTHHMGFKEMSIEGAEEALRLEPDNEDYKKALEYFRNGTLESLPMGVAKVEEEVKGT